MLAVNRAGIKTQSKDMCCLPHKILNIIKICFRPINN